MRHDASSSDQRPPEYPVASNQLNDDIAHAIFACHEHGQADYTLWLGYGDLLLLDYHIRRDYKTSEGAFGRAILLKVFKARETLRVDSLLEDWPLQEATAGGDEDDSYAGITAGNNDEDSGEDIAGYGDWAIT